MLLFEMGDKRDPALRMLRKEVNALLMNAYTLANVLNMPYMIRENAVITSTIKS